MLCLDVTAIIYIFILLLSVVLSRSMTRNLMCELHIHRPYINQPMKIVKWCKRTVVPHQYNNVLTQFKIFSFVLFHTLQHCTSDGRRHTSIEIKIVEIVTYLCRTVTLPTAAAAGRLQLRDETALICIFK